MKILQKWSREVKKLNFVYCFLHYTKMKYTKKYYSL